LCACAKLNELSVYRARDGGRSSGKRCRYEGGRRGRGEIGQGGSFGKSATEG